MVTRVDEEYQQLKKQVHAHLIDRLDEEGIEVELTERGQLENFVRANVTQYIASQRIPLATADQIMLARETLDEIVGYGPLEPLLADDQINDILVNGPTSIFVEVAGVLQKAQTRFIDDDHVMRIVRRILAPLGRRLDESSRWWTRGCRTVLGSTPLFRPSPWTGRRSPSANLPRNT